MDSWRASQQATVSAEMPPTCLFPSAPSSRSLVIMSSLAYLAARMSGVSLPFPTLSAFARKSTTSLAAMLTSFLETAKINGVSLPKKVHPLSLCNCRKNPSHRSA